MNPCNYSKKVKLFGLRGWLAIAVLLSILNITSVLQHAMLLLFTLFLWFIEKKRGYVIENYFYYLRTRLGGRRRDN